MENQSLDQKKSLQVAENFLHGERKSKVQPKSGQFSKSAHAPGWYPQTPRHFSPFQQHPGRHDCHVLVATRHWISHSGNENLSNFWLLVAIVASLLHEIHKMHFDSLQQHDFLQNEFGKSIVLSA